MVNQIRLVSNVYRNPDYYRVQYFSRMATQTDQFIAPMIMNVRYGVWSGRAAPLMSPFGCRRPLKPSAVKGYAWQMENLLQMLTAIK